MAKRIRKSKGQKMSALAGVLVLLLLVGVGIAIASIYNKKTPDLAENPETTTTEMECPQVITSATNDKTGEIREFPSPCDIPAGWTSLKEGEAKDISGSYVFIKKMTTAEGVTYMEVDPINWYEGDEAARQIKKDNPNCETEYGPGCVPPEGFYISNKDKTVARYQVSPTASVTVQTLEKDAAGMPKFEQKITVARLLQVFSAPKEDEAHFGTTPFVIDIHGGKVTRVLEQYVP